MKGDCDSLTGSYLISLLIMDACSNLNEESRVSREASFFFGVRIMLGTILGRFSIIYFRLGLRIKVMVWVMVRARVRVWVRVGVRVSVVLWYW